MINAATRNRSFSIQQIAAIVVPLLLIPIMTAVFVDFNQLFGSPLGYLWSMVVYWVIWCTLVPLALLGGWRPFAGLFRPVPSLPSMGWKINLLLWWPVTFPLAFIFIPRVASTPLIIVAASIVLGILIGVTEEVLWRGVYLRLFPNNGWLNLIYPSVMFALWHIAPQSVVVNRMPGGVFSFVAYALVLGLSYGVAARRTGSITWPTIAHIIHDSLGIGAAVYAAWLIR